LGHGLRGCLGGQTAKWTPQRHSAVTAEIFRRGQQRMHRLAQAREDARLPDKADMRPETSFD
jgi:hypothetical protein